MIVSFLLAGTSQADELAPMPSGAECKVWSGSAFGVHCYDYEFLGQKI